MFKPQFQKSICIILHGSCSTNIEDQIKDIWKITEIPTSLFSKLLLPCTESAIHATTNLL